MKKSNIMFLSCHGPYLSSRQAIFFKATSHGILESSLYDEPTDEPSNKIHIYQQFNTRSPQRPQRYDRIMGENKKSLEFETYGIVKKID